MAIPWQLSSLRRAADRFATTYLRTLSFKVAFPILVLIIGHGFVYVAVEFNLISYLTEIGEKQSLYKSAAVVNIYEGISAIVVSNIVAYITEANIISRFRVIVFCIASHFIGIVVLWHSHRLVLVYGALLLVAVGAAGRDPPLKQFLAVQLEHQLYLSKGMLQDHQLECERNTNAQSEQVCACRDFWWKVAWGVGSIISVFVLAAKNDYFVEWGKLFMISAIVAGTTSLLFLCFSCFYHCKKSDPTTNNEPRRNDPCPRSEESRQLNWFLRGPVLRWVYEQMEPQFILTLLPLCSTFLVYGLVAAAGSTFFIVQSEYLDDQVPINTFFLLRSILSKIVSLLAGLVVHKVSMQQLARLVRIGMGMTFSTICCFVASYVESRRLSLIKAEKVANKDFSTSMSVLWLAPQFCLLGFMEALAVDGLTDFFSNNLRTSTGLLESSISDSVLAVGKLLSVVAVLVFRSWFGDDISKYHLDRYYLMLGIMSCGNLIFYCFISSMYRTNQEFQPQPQNHPSTRDNSNTAVV